MAFPPDDQTDEDFFDKLVDDDIIPPNSHPDRAPSSLSLPDDAAEDTPLAREEETGDKHAPTADENISPAAAASGGGQQSSPGGGSKGTSVKVVQWSAFSIDSQEPFDAGGFGSSSDFLTENAFAEPESSLVREPDTEQQNAQYYGSATEQASDMDNTQYWENMYPGWKYDHSTGQWYQVDSCGNAQPESYDATAGHGGISESSGGMSYLQQSTPSVLETIAEDCAMSSVSNLNQGSYGASDYPPNMLFDPQYPGWYYDTSTQQWYALESYTQAVQGTASTAQGQATVDRNASGSFVSDQNYSLHSGVSQHEQYTTRDHGTHKLRGSWDSSSSNDHHHNLWQPEAVDHSGQIVGFPVENQALSFSCLTDYATSHKDQQISFKTFEPVSSHTYSNNNSRAGNQGFVPAENMHHFNQPKVDQSIQKHLSDSYYSTQNSANYAQQPFQGANGSYSQLSYVPSSAGRSPDGRPPHALVAFGFGGKLIIMKDNTSSAKSDFGSQGVVGGSVSILSLMEAVLNKVDASTVISGSGYDYFHALCQQSFPGPLSGGNAATKDVTKWIDQRIMSCESPSLNFQKGEQLRLLLSLLRISCQHYGKLRSPFGADPSLEGSDSPELAVTKLFAGKNSAQMREYGSLTHCIQNLPSEGQLRATAVDVQTLLVSGRRKEALQCAQEGQLWGPALVLAAQLGEKFYVDTVKQMAHLQFISGSPLRTLCLLIAGQPADVFSGDCLANSLSGAVNAPQPAEIRATAMLDGWEENLAIITANRTKDDELVIIHLGDCLWKERGEITAAHTCYLVAEANFEAYSDSARLCLIGADHWKYPRTYASPEAIQRTEMYEYSKVLGNSQFILLPFQPYKLIYAYMLAEVGKVADSLRYCQASLKLLKNSGRAPEVDMWKSLLSSLEDRLRAHQQGGYSTNLDPAKLVGKLFTSIDRSIHRMIGAPPPPLPPMPENNKNGRENYSLSPKVSNSQSTMAMSSLIPSASVEGISELTADSRRKPRHNRSISEPNFGGTPKQDAGSADSQGKAWGGPSRFGRIGSQLLQKTMGWVARSRPDHQAKLGERNKFYYDEKLKRWVEEGAESPAEEAALPPPPTTAVFQNGTSDYNISSAIKSRGSSPSGGPEKNSPVPVENNSGIPPIPYSQNQFSTRGRMGVRSRYVDTFNKGAGASTNTFQSASASSMKPAAGAKFFIPSMHAPSDGHGVDAPGGGKEEATINGEPCTSTVKYASPSSPTSSSSSPSMQPSELPMPRFPSMDNLNMTSGGSLRSGNSSVSIARRASWSGTNMDAFNPKTDARKPTGDGHGVPSSLTSNDPSPIQSSSSSSLQHSGGNAGYELHEVEL